MTRVDSGIDLFQNMIIAKAGQRMSADLGTWSTSHTSYTRNIIDLGHSYLSDPR